MKNKGFTLFELLVSISIIALLTALATISFSSAQKKARDSKRIQDMENGNVVEQGRHAALMAAKGRYWALYESKFSNEPAPV